ncbi:FimV/HubP family polar landmark protein [Vibrio nomapromontoriensis]|uniref:FimV/HubP family polar landmark protein n=1 Tax=Vibrio nomapromontoriensis TaxID=2910246 RepID=UPI003D0993E3
MHHFFKRLLVALALVGATTSSSFSADTIRLSGPNGELLDAPHYSEQIRRPVSASVADEPSRYYGPTKRSETLWSIASKFKPTGASVQQTIYAFYELNPGVFEDENIHKLIPGNRLRVPSSTQINQVDRQEALSVLAAHQQRLTSNKATVKPKIEPKPVAKVTPSVETPIAKTSAQPPLTSDANDNKAVDSKIIDSKVIDNKGVDKKAIAESVEKSLTNKLQQELTRSEDELISLEERNHQLRLMLSKVQQQVDTLQDEVSNEERIRSEVERQLLDEKRKQEEMQRLAPTAMDTWLSNPWIVGLLAIVPALFVGLLVMLVMRTRKSKTNDGAWSHDNNEHGDAASVAAMGAAGAAVMASDTAESMQDDDDLFSDELFGDFETDVDTDEAATKQEKEAENDIFADLNEGDLDFNLDDEDDPFASIGDDGELDIGFVDLDASNNGISVKDGEKALGLEEMERALNDVAVPESDLDDLDLNLSDEDETDPVSQQELDDLFAEINMQEPSLDEQFEIDEPVESDDGAINQAQMDELLSSGFDLDESEADALDDIFAEQESVSDTSLADTPESNAGIEVGNDDIDDLFAQFSQIDTPSDTPPQTQAQSEKSESSDEVALLDEMLGDDFELSNISDSDLMLEEIVDSESPDQVLQSKGENSDENNLDDDINLDENSTDLLDELMFEHAFDAPDKDDHESLALDPFESGQLLTDDEPEAHFKLEEESELTEEQDAFAELFSASDEELEAQEHATRDSETTQASAQDALSLGDSSELEEVDELEGVEEVDAPDELDDIDALLAQHGSQEPLAEVTSELNHEPVLSDADIQQPDLTEQDNVPSSDIAASDIDADSDFDIDSLLEQNSIQDKGAEKASDEHVTDADVADVDAGFQATLDDAIEAIATSAPSEALAREHANDTVPPTIDGEFDFSPQIEGGVDAPDDDFDAEREQAELNALVENEFGIPHDDDWNVDSTTPVEPNAVAHDAVEPEVTVKPDMTSPPQDSEAALSDEANDDEFLDSALSSEYSEAQALADSEDDYQFDSDEVVGEEQAFAVDDTDLPEYSEEDALADVLAMGALKDELSADTNHHSQQDADEEPELVNEALERQEASTASSPITEVPATEMPLTESGVADVNDDGDALNTGKLDETFSHDDIVFPEYTEEDALADSADSADVDSAEQHPQSEISALEEPAQAFSTQEEMVGETLDHSEIDALADAFSMVDTQALEQEGQLGELLSDGKQGFSNINPVDQTTADSAGLDLATMLEDDTSMDGGEDWNGFTLTDAQKNAIDQSIPDEEQAIWTQDAGSLKSAKNEDWSSQDPVENFEDSSAQFMTIDELMAQVNDEPQSEVDEEEALQLDVGLDEFPDVIGEVTDVDVDNDSEASGNLDLAKIYIEMNDFDGAKKLLQKVLDEGSESLKDEARGVLDKMSAY